MSLRLVTAIPVLPIRDLPKALAFYTERLGFEVLFELGPYAGVGRDGVELHLSVEQGTPVTCRIGVREVDGWYEQMSAQQVVDPDEPLATQPWGMRQFSVRDADGNRITFAEPAERRTRAFAITFTHVEGAAANLSKEDISNMIESHGAWEREVAAQPHSSLVYFANAAEAKTVRRDASGELSVLDGPFTRGPEAAGGFYVVEAESLDAAVEIAKRHRWLPGSNEVREISAPPGAGWWIGPR